MTDFTYSNEFLGITGTIDGGDFHGLFQDLMSSINSKADRAGPVTHSGTHTFTNITLTGTLTAQTVDLQGTLSMSGSGKIDGGTY